MPDPQPINEVAQHPIANTLLGSALLAVGSAFVYIARLGTRLSIVENQQKNDSERLERIDDNVAMIVEQLIQKKR